MTAPTPTQTREINPEDLSIKERYKLLIGCITPRPIAFVSTASQDGTPNLAPYSFFNAASSHPMTVLFCPVTRPDGHDKDTLRNLLPKAEGGLGSFVVNLAVERYAKQMACTAESLPHGQSEFELSGLTPAKSTKVKAPRLLESPVSFECETSQIVRLDPNEPSSGNVVFGKVVHIWIDDELINDQLHVDQQKLATVGRLGGMQYTRTRETFELPNGRPALNSPLPF